MRPASIQWFERIYFATLAIGLINLLIHYGTLSEVLGGSGQTMGIVLISFLAGIAISLVFWYLVARRASTIAKWFLVVLVVIGLIGLPGGFAMTETLGIAYVGIGALSTLLQAIATGLLFTPESRRWFASKGAPAGPETFE
ncbi:hypothetical protein [Novosphingobium sp. CECT 9465]|uniref:hypothetical protein n=1 Tax=Novosphingobium sp. CECT 9465 TaxID=2829794 RepID=UPI001E30BDC4|nr:hypothetical protein [Novosphingobium sp. CECT 9465]CAH0498338.1 hypothetical protein NVSP9465_03423 [Novosphingobium sp. CECT 9465]